MKKKKHTLRTIILVVAMSSLLLGVLFRAFPGLLSTGTNDENESNSTNPELNDVEYSNSKDDAGEITSSIEPDACVVTDDIVADEQKKDGKDETEPDENHFDLLSIASMDINEILFDDNIDVRNCFDLSKIPEYQTSPYAELNDNKPFFSKIITVKAKENPDFYSQDVQFYSQLDTIGRCGVVYEIVSKELLPTEERGQIGSIQPTGWQTAKYPDIVEDLYLYNRCHLIGYQLGGGNANELNLITGTRYFNIQGMLPFENSVVQYVESSGNHVLYRVTPIFELKNLVASGVVIEAESLEDFGKGIEFCVYVYNVQPGIVIDYETGDSREMSENELASLTANTTMEIMEKSESVDETKKQVVNDGKPVGDDNANSFVPVGDSDDSSSIGTREIRNDAAEKSETYTETKEEKERYYVLNMNTNKFHIPTCDSVNDMKDKNKEISYQSRDEIIARGYVPCKRCNP